MTEAVLGKERLQGIGGERYQRVVELKLIAALFARDVREALTIERSRKYTRQQVNYGIAPLL